MGKYRALVQDHLIVPAVVRLPAGSERLRRRNQNPVPTPIPVQLVLDTGSKRTTVIPGIIRHLDPEPGRDVRLVTPLASGTVTLFWVRLDFPGTTLSSFEEIQVGRVAMPPELSQFHGVLGRDILCRLESFEYEGRRGRYTLRDTPGLFGWLRRRL
jgi:hypothetical protein